MIQKAKGIHNGLNTHHQLQSILSNILAKKNAKNINTVEGDRQPIVTFLLFSILITFTVSTQYTLITSSNMC